MKIGISTRFWHFHDVLHFSLFLDLVEWRLDWQLDSWGGGWSGTSSEMFKWWEKNLIMITFFCKIFLLSKTVGCIAENYFFYAC